MSFLTDAAQMTFDSDGDNTKTALKSRAGTLCGAIIYNPNSSDAYVQLFDATTANVTVGTTTPNAVLPVPAQGAIEFTLPTQGIGFSSAITYACTTTATGSGDPSTGLTCTFFYQ